MSKDKQIGAALAARLAQIRIANSYATEAGQKVFRGRRAIDPGHMPCLVIIDGDDEPGEHELPHVGNVLTLVIEAHGACDPNHPNDAAHALVADIKRAVFSGDTAWGGLALATRYGGRSIRPRTDGTAFVTAAVELKIDIVENLAAP